MAQMSTNMQRRIGILSKSPSNETLTGSIYGNTHRGYGMRKPTATSTGMPGGFFGYKGMHKMSGHHENMSAAHSMYGQHSAGNAHSMHGDKKLHYFGNAHEGQKGMPSMGFYGLGSAELDYQIANMMIPGELPDQAPMSGVVDDTVTTLTNNPIKTAMVAAGAINAYTMIKKSR